ncbi:hypothetical protein [Sphaerospermopsis torques-reginae]|uniref:Uncharacterized protein n=1 Tax=Sphaerospermopsis torques-reginae ITEP-024 TaxID=984208 RepID=A0ABX8WWX0_9CYAN|nr:hypothetical protein [Sphaerospermopsis torques-reginae]QYX30646.1 hypothetical protein K2F26_17405 [Sphaerospermopsis torques-reginae ITEP-024]
MNNDQNLPSGNLSAKLQAIAAAVQEAAQACQGNVTALLSLLRQLEKLHKEIRDGIFQDSLPDNRQRLYALLRDIESEGGWPYIERMRLQEFLVNLPVESNEKTPVIQNTNDSCDTDNWLEW